MYYVPSEAEPVPLSLAITSPCFHVKLLPANVGKQQEADEYLTQAIGHC